MLGKYPRYISCISFFLFVLGGVFDTFFMTPSAAAQSFNLGGGSLNLIVSPDSPKPYSPITVSIDDYSIDTLGSTITWYVDGEELANSKNERSVSLETGALGTPQEISVLITNPKSPAFSVRKMVTPIAIDIILESDTYTPYFYKGRALPSTEATVRAIAVVHDGTELPDTRYTYKWTLNDSVLYGGPVLGKNVASFTMPHYDGARLTVEVLNKDSEFVGKKSFTFGPTTPEMHFYENSVLRGLSQKETLGEYALTREETTIFAEPYFMNVSSIDTSLTDILWKINNEDAGASSETPNAITLKRIGEEGNAHVECSIVTKGKIPQYVGSSFQAYFQ
jgi:hypothetical protein